MIATIVACDGVIEIGIIEASAIKLDIPMLFDLLYSDAIWICDSGALGHLSKRKRGARNLKGPGSQSLGHSRKAVEALDTMDFARQFIGKMVAQE